MIFVLMLVNVNDFEIFTLIGSDGFLKHNKNMIFKIIAFAFLFPMSYFKQTFRLQILRIISPLLMLLNILTASWCVRS